jgi:hypothetical protein
MKSKYTPPDGNVMKGLTDTVVATEEVAVFVIIPLRVNPFVETLVADTALLVSVPVKLALAAVRAPVTSTLPREALVAWNALAASRVELVNVPT